LYLNFYKKNSKAKIAKFFNFMGFTVCIHRKHTNSKTEQTIFHTYLASTYILIELLHAE